MSTPLPAPARIYTLLITFPSCIIIDGTVYKSQNKYLRISPVTVNHTGLEASLAVKLNYNYYDYTCTGESPPPRNLLVIILPIAIIGGIILILAVAVIGFIVYWHCCSK